MAGVVFYEYSKKIFRNIFIAFLMSVICLTSVLIYSALKYHSYQFKPFKELDDKAEMKFFAWSTDMFRENTRNIMKKGAKQYNVKYASLFNGDERGILYTYDEWAWKNWMPRLKEGKWLDKNSDGELPEVVFIGKNDNVKIGDTLEFSYFVSGEEQNTFKCKVSGLLQNGAAILGDGEMKLGTEKYTNCYFEVNREKMDGDTFYVLIKSSDLTKYNISGLDFYNSIWSVLDYNTEGMTQEEISEKKEKMMIKAKSSAMPYEEFMDNSKAVYKLQIMIYAPLFFLSLFLVALVIYNVTRIDLQDSSYDHSVYYLLGANKKRCNRISTYKLLINILVSVILFICEVIIYSKIAEKYNLNFYTGSYIAMIAVFIYAGLMLYTVLVNYLMSRGMTPVDMLRKNRTAI